MTSLRQRLEDFYRKYPEGLGQAEQWDCAQTPAEAPSAALQHVAAIPASVESEMPAPRVRPPVQTERSPD